MDLKRELTNYEIGGIGDIKNSRIFLSAAR